MISDDETNFHHKLLLTNRQVVNLCKAFADKSSNDMKLSKTQISKMIQSGGFLGRILGPLLKVGLPLLKNVIKPLAKSVLIHLRWTAAASAADTGTHKKILGSDRLHSSSSALPHRPLSLHNITILITSNDEMKDIIEIVKSLEDSSLLPEGVSETTQNETKKQRGGFPSMLWGTLCVSLLWDILTGKRAIPKRVSEETKSKRQSRGGNRAGNGIVRAGYGNKNGQERQDHKNKVDF